MTDQLIVDCVACGHRNEFPQPYAYHAGFGHSAFLYNESGNCTLIWGIYDSAYVDMAGENAWQPSPEEQANLESRLPLSPRGDRWLSSNPARCMKCRNPIRSAMIDGEIYYLEYPDSIILGRAGLPSSLGEFLLAARLPITR